MLWFFAAFCSEEKLTFLPFKRKRPYLGLDVEGGKGSLPVVGVASSSEGAMSTGVEEEERKRTNRGCLPLVLGTSLKGWPCIASEITIALPNMNTKGNAWPRQE